MSAIQITEGLLSAWRDHQLAHQQLLIRNWSDPSLPLPPPTLEEFADTIRVLAEFSTNYRMNAEGMRNWEFDDRLYMLGCLEAARLEIPQDDMLPLASFTGGVVYFRGNTVHPRGRVGHGIYVLSRPPSYMSRLDTMVIPTMRTPEFGRTTAGTFITPTSIILPPSWYEVPLLLMRWDGAHETWAKLCTFNPGVFSDRSDIEVHIPNGQNSTFYRRVDSGQVCTYFLLRRCAYLYASGVRPATSEETVSWIDQLEPGTDYNFPNANIGDVLASIGVASRTVSVAMTRALQSSGTSLEVENPQPTPGPGVPTDVTAPEGGPRRPRGRTGNFPAFVSIAQSAASMTITSDAAVAIEDDSVPVAGGVHPEPSPTSQESRQALAAQFIAPAPAIVRSSDGPRGRRSI